MYSCYIIYDTSSKTRYSSLSSVLSEGDLRGHTPSVLQDEDSFLSTPPSHDQSVDETLRMLEEVSCSSSSGDDSRASDAEGSEDGGMEEEEEEEEDEEEDEEEEEEDGEW